MIARCTVWLYSVGIFVYTAAWLWAVLNSRYFKTNTPPSESACNFLTVSVVFSRITSFEYYKIYFLLWVARRDSTTRCDRNGYGDGGVHSLFTHTTTESFDKLLTPSVSPYHPTQQHQALPRLAATALRTLGISN